jgi:hypothetical protein
VAKCVDYFLKKADVFEAGSCDGVEESYDEGGEGGVMKCPSHVS